MSSIIEKRKKEHLELCSNSNVSFEKKTTLLECVELNYSSLPEINLNDIDLSTRFLGKNFSFPFLISAITGGAEIAKKVNFDIAIACEELGVGFGLGSMRAMIEKPSLKETYFVRNISKNIFVAGNLGIAQLLNYSSKQIDSALQSIEANALALHVNSAQEAVQLEGDTNFSNLLEKIDLLIDELSIPVYVKEVGHGISIDLVKKLSRTKIRAIDVQGAGGTSWTKVDSLRNSNSYGKIFSDIGFPTAISIINTKKALANSDKKIIGSGGIRNGLDAVKAIVLGADLVGNALPILQAQQKNGSKEIINYLKNFEKEMKISMFLTGSKNLVDLKKQDYFVFGLLKEWLEQQKTIK